MLAEKSKLWLVFTIILGLVTTLLVYKYINSLKAEVPIEKFNKYVTAAKKIPEGTRLNKEMLTSVELPDKYALNGISDINLALNKVVSVTLFPGQVLLSDQLVSLEKASDMTYTLPEGTRAVSIAITAPSGVGGFAKPGDYVDIILTYKHKIIGATNDSEKTEEEYRTVTLAQNKLIMAVGSDMYKKEENQPGETVTLAVSPEDAENIAMGENIGKLKLILRPAAENRINPLKAVDRKALFVQYP